LKNENSRLKGQIEDLESENSRINQELIKLRGKVSSLEGQSGAELEWKFKYEESVTIIKKLRL